MFVHIVNVNSELKDLFCFEQCFYFLSLRRIIIHQQSYDDISCRFARCCSSFRYYRRTSRSGFKLSESNRDETGGAGEFWELLKGYC